MKNKTKKNNHLIQIFSFNVVDDPLPNNYDAFVNAELDKISTEMIQTGSPEAITILLNIHEKYPTLPVVLNNLAFCYQVQGNLEKSKALLEKLNQNCPDYLFGRLSRARNALYDNRPEDVPAIFNHCFHLKALYPTRDTFHITEVTHFSHVMSLYFCAIHDMKNAKIHFDFLKQLTNEDDQRVKDLSLMIIAGSILEFANRTKNRRKKQINKKRVLKKENS